MISKVNISSLRSVLRPRYLLPLAVLVTGALLLIVGRADKNTHAPVAVSYAGQTASEQAVDVRENPFALGSSDSESRQSLIEDSLTSESYIMASTPRVADGPPISPLLEGTDIDGQLMADREGRLIVDIGLRDFFEYFLNTQVDIGLDAAIAALQQYADSYLPEPARSQAAQLLARYVEYKQFNVELMNTPLDPTQPLSTEEYAQLMRDSFDKLQKAQNSIFGPQVSDVLFGSENAYAEFAIYSMEVQSNSELSAQEQQRLIEDKRQQLPADMYRTESNQLDSLARDQAVQSALLDAEDEHQATERLREIGIDDESAESLLAWEASQRRFLARYASYRLERDAFKASSQYVGDALLETLRPIRERYFDTSEHITQAHLQDLEELSL